MRQQIKYLHSQKATNDNIERILFGFACNLPAKTTAEVIQKSTGKRPALNSVTAIYQLVRKRCHEIGYFPDASKFLDTLRAETETHWEWTPAAVRFDVLLKLPHVRTKSYDMLVLEEMLFRAENPHHTPEQIFRDIRLVVKITGPLNGQPINLHIWREHATILHWARFIARLRRPKRSPSAKLRSGHSDTERPLIAHAEGIIRQAEKRLRALRRPRPAEVKRSQRSASEA